MAVLDMLPVSSYDVKDEIAIKFSLSNGEAKQIVQDLLDGKLVVLGVNNTLSIITNYIVGT